MRQWVDVSAPISEGVRPYIPGVPYASFRPVFTLERDGVESHELTISTLSGSYFETARHVRADAPTVDAVPADCFISPATLIDVGQKGAGEAITVADLEGDGRWLRAGDAAIVRTGWSRQWNTPSYFDDSPYFTEEALDWLLDKGIRILAGDFPSFDSRRNPVGIVRRLFESTSRYLLAPLVNLEGIAPGRVTLYAFPLPVVGVSGAPARVFIAPADG